MAIVGVGVDVEDLDRWTTPDLRLFTADEIEYCAARSRPAESFAGRWCAKEAVIKALAGVAKLTTRDVAVDVAGDGRPLAKIPQYLRESGIEVHISIAHSSTSATAYAVASRPSQARSSGSLQGC